MRNTAINKACRRIKDCLSFRGAIMAQALTTDNRRDSHLPLKPRGFEVSFDAEGEIRNRSLIFPTANQQIYLS